MKNKSSLFVSVSAAVLMPLALFAQEGVPAGVTGEQKQQMQQGVMESAKKERAALQKAQQARDEMKVKAEELRKEMRIRMGELKAKRQEVEAEMKKKREEFKAGMEERKAELKKKLGGQKAQRIEQFFAAMMKKFEEAIDRLKGVADKIENRLTSSTAAAEDVAVLQAKLAVVRAKITEAELALADAKAKYTDAVESSDFRESFKKVNELVRGVAAKVKEAHRALIGVTSSIKQLGSRGRNAGATTTPGMGGTTGQ